MIFESSAGSETAARVKELGIYHQDISSLEQYMWWPESCDCLGRTRLHRVMDGMRKSGLLGFLRLSGLDVGADGSDQLNKQDILGRTPLHIVCQSVRLGILGSLVKQMLDLGADPGLATTYGHIPLHYAAAKGSVKVCTVLLEHKSTFSIGAKDENNRTALDYAIIKKIQNIVDLLSARYAEAGLSEELEHALRIEKETKKGWFDWYSQE